MAGLQSSAEGVFTLPDPLPAQAVADSPYPIEGPLPTLSNGEPDAEVMSIAGLMALELGNLKLLCLLPVTCVLPLVDVYLSLMHF